ncbi:geranylgeranyl reductase family protein [[Eubacterium] cellulosolvens]
MKIYDLLIIGSGSSGCIAAETAVRKGYNICLIDCKPIEGIGDKVCGDAISKHHFDNLGIDYPKGEELEHNIKGIEIYSPNLNSVFRMEDRAVTGFIINRSLFGQRLLNMALDAGVTFFDNTVAIEPILLEGFVKGVKVRNKKNERVEEIQAKIVMDASGVSAALRRNLPSDFGIENHIERQDLMSCHREIRDNIDFDSDYCKIYLNLKFAPGGYYWVFPKGEGKVNVGLGVQAKEDSPSPKAQLYKYVFSNEIFRKSSIIDSGGGFVPTRRPMDSLVSNGVMLLGDAACLVNPIHGGGIGPSMLSGKLATEVAIDALSNNVPSIENLWEYNQKYMKEYGAKQASLDVFRIFLQSINDDDLNYGMENQIIKPKDVLEANINGELKLNINDKIERAFRGIKKINILINLRNTAKKMKQIRNIYNSYPEIEKFAEWKKEVSKIRRS